MTTSMDKVVLRSVPVDIYVGLQRHIDELVRELQVIEVGGDKAVPPGLRDVMNRILTDYASARTDSWEQASNALSQGKDRADLIFHLPVEAETAVAEFNELLDRADGLCRSGALLTLPESEDQRKFRHWATQQIVGQLTQGQTPEDCPI